MKKTRIRLSLFSLVLALVLFGLTIRLTGRDPLVVYWSILTGSFGSTKSFLNVLAYMLPLIMTGLGAAVAFQSGVFNIGGEGQVLVGGLASVIVGLTVPLPAPWGWLLALLAGFAAGALWALLPTLFAGRNLTSLSVATIMMNSIAALLTEYIVKSYFQRPGASNTETVVVNEGSILPRIFPSTQFNYGILVALFCVVVVTWMLYKTPFGFPVLIPLFISAFRRANELAYAMECRCYRGGDGRTKMKVMKFEARDYIALAAVIVFIALLISFNFIFKKVI